MLGGARQHQIRDDLRLCALHVHLQQNAAAGVGEGQGPGKTATFSHNDTQTFFALCFECW